MRSASYISHAHIVSVMHMLQLESEALIIPMHAGAYGNQYAAIHKCMYAASFAGSHAAEVLAIYAKLYVAIRIYFSYL